MSSTLIPTLAASAKNALVALWSADINAMRFTFISTAILTIALKLHLLLSKINMAVINF